MDIIEYKEGYKYQLSQQYQIDLNRLVPDGQALWSKVHVIDDFIIFSNGKLTIMQGYAWDGPSGPAIDTTNFMRGSLVHDALYQLLENRLITAVDHEEFRKLADTVLYIICLQDGMSRIRANWVYYGVRTGGWFAAREKKATYLAPSKETV